MFPNPEALLKHCQAAFSPYATNVDAKNHLASYEKLAAQLLSPPQQLNEHLSQLLQETQQKLAQEKEKRGLAERALTQTQQAEKRQIQSLTDQLREAQKQYKKMSALLDKTQQEKNR